jgi:hypothetical protein
MGNKRLTYLSWLVLAPCPNDVTARSDSDALFEVAVEALGEFGKPEILDRSKTLTA